MARPPSTERTYVHMRQRQTGGSCGHIFFKSFLRNPLHRKALILYTTLCILGVYGILQVMDGSH